MPSKYESALESLTDEGIERALRRDLAVMGFAEIEPMLQAIRKDLIAASLTPIEELPDVAMNADSAVKEQLPELMRFLSEWNPAADSNASNTRTSYISHAHQLMDTIATHLRPFLRPDVSAIGATEKRLSELEHSLRADSDRAQVAAADAVHAVEEAKVTLAQVKTEAAQDAAGRISGYYKKAADDNALYSRWYLIASAVSAGVLVVAVGVVFWVVASETTNLPHTIRDLSGRLVVLLVLTAAVAFCVRNYRINKHLEVLNRTRYNALETASLFLASVTDDSARNIVVAELVRAVFSPGDTGFMRTDREQTIIESPGSLLGVATSSAGQAARQAS